MRGQPHGGERHMASFAFLGLCLDLSYCIVAICRSKSPYADPSTGLVLESLLTAGILHLNTSADPSSLLLLSVSTSYVPIFPTTNQAGISDTVHRPKFKYTPPTDAMTATLLTPYFDYQYSCNKRHVSF